jgi:hypothetical protein
VYLRFVRAGLPHHPQFVDLRPPLLLFAPSPLPRSKPPRSPLTSVPLISHFACSSPLFLPPPSTFAPSLPPLPLRGRNTDPGFHNDGDTTNELPDPSTAQGGLSGVHTQPWRPAAHDIVLGYRNRVSSRLARRCQSRQQFRGIWLYLDPCVYFPRHRPRWPAVLIMVGHRTDVSSKSNVVSFPSPIAPNIYLGGASCTYRWRFSSHHTPHIGGASPPQEVLSHSLQALRSHRRPFKADSDPTVCSTDDTILLHGIHHHHPTPL